MLSTMSNKAKRILMAVVLAGGLLAATGCGEEMGTSFAQGFEYGYNHPEVAASLLGLW